MKAFGLAFVAAMTMTSTLAFAGAKANMSDVLKGLDASQVKHTSISDDPCISANFCSVEVEGTQIDAQGRMVSVLTSSSLPTEDYILLCSATLAGLAGIDPVKASSLVGEGFGKSAQSRRSRSSIGNVTFTAAIRSDGAFSCRFFRK